MSLTRVPSTARIKILASSTSALLAIPLLLAGDPPDRFVLVHEFVFGGTPGRDHRVKVLSGGTHRLNFGLPASLLSGNEEAQRLPMARYRQRATALQVAREILSKLADADLFGFHIVYSLYTIATVESGLWRVTVSTKACAVRFSLQRLRTQRIDQHPRPTQVQGGAYCPVLHAALCQATRARDISSELPPPNHRQLGPGSVRSARPAR